MLHAGQPTEAGLIHTQESINMKSLFIYLFFTSVSDWLMLAQNIDSIYGAYIGMA